jgi:transcriptional regulator with XRE-family HTH domain
MPSERARAVFEYVGANVGLARTRAGLTQEALAEAADIDLRFLQRVERGKTNLSVAVVVAIADALGVEPGQLLKPAKLPTVRKGRPPARTSGSRK